MAHEHPVPATDRASMLISCPANAPSWAPEPPYPPGLPGEIEHRREEQSIWRRQSLLSTAADSAADYLEGLPPDQAGGLRLDTAHGGIVVQVTRAAEQVRSELQSMIGDDVLVTMETVRFSRTELASIAVAQLPGLRWISIGAGNCNGRVEVTVPGDSDEARRLIEDVADPCSFAVTRGDSARLAALMAAAPLATAAPAIHTAVPAPSTDQDR